MLAPTITEKYEQLTTTQNVNKRHRSYEEEASKMVHEREIIPDNL
jgi:hypothetical protein